MPQARCNGIDLEYEVIGNSGPPMLLIMGIGAQLVHWEDPFCEQLAARGFTVIRFDNRDVGLSSKLHGQRVPPLPEVVVRALLGLRIRTPYTLSDMADDSAGLLDALDIDRAHVCGVSMGGMIAQTLALRHPHRVRTLTSIMSTTGDRSAGLPKVFALRALLGPAPRSRDEAMELSVKLFRTIGSPGAPRDDASMREIAARAYDRCRYPQGFLRQFAAILASGGRARALKHLRTPTLVLHGADDPLIPPSAGRATARAIPGARLEIIPRMGHDLAPASWPAILDPLTAHARAH